MHDLAAEAVAALEFRGEALVVAVVTAGAEEPTAAHRPPLAGVGPLGLDEPPGVVGRPGGTEHLVVEPDLVVQAVLGGRLTQVSEDRGRAGDRLVVLPWLELITEGVQVRIGADARVAEEIPRSAGRAPSLQDRVCLVRLLGL